jgi:hypothetical protein
MNDLASADSLQAAGFPVTPDKQERFLSDVVTRRHSRLELLARPWVTGLAGGLLSAAFAFASARRGDPQGAMAGGAAALSHFAVALIGLGGQRTRSGRDAGANDACYRDDEGKLRLVLGEGESVIVQRAADGEVKSTPRRIGSLFQMMWGTLLGGLPLAFAGGRDLVGLSLGAVAVGTFVGTWVFGRGVAHLLGAKPIERLVITDKRVAALVAPGGAHVVPLQSLHFRPVVVGREEGRATFALGQRPQPAVRPLPVVGL